MRGMAAEHGYRGRAEWLNYGVLAVFITNMFAKPHKFSDRMNKREAEECRVSARSLFSLRIDDGASNIDCVGHPHCGTVCCWPIIFIQMTDNLTLRVQSEINAIAPASAEAEAWLQSKGMPADATFLVGLAFEELVTNCIKHGFDDDDEHLIEIVLSVSDQTLTILVIDDGRAFDASRAPRPDLSQELEDRPVGGLGIHLLRELSDSMSYERRDGKNHLTLTKKLG